MEDLRPAPGDLEPVQTWDRERIAALQLERLQWTLPHAYDNVGHHREAWDAAGVRPEDCRSVPLVGGDAGTTGIACVEVVDPTTIERSVGKMKRIVDLRHLKDT